jgi:hypothetical protein
MKPATGLRPQAGLFGRLCRSSRSHIFLSVNQLTPPDRFPDYFACREDAAPITGETSYAMDFRRHAECLCRLSNRRSLEFMTNTGPCRRLRVAYRTGLG